MPFAASTAAKVSSSSPTCSVAPLNLAISLMEAGRIEVIAGINLPMLIRLAKARGCMNVRDATAAARDAGRNYITIASEFLGQDA
jgi:PTS system mannose-specific IIA component